MSLPDYETTTPGGIVTPDTVTARSWLGFGFQALQARLEKIVPGKRLSACQFASNNSELAEGFGDSAM